MKNLIAFYILMLGFINSYAQELPTFSCNEKVDADISAIREAIQDKIDNPEKINFLRTQALTMKDADEMQIINWLYIYADTINNEVMYKINKDNFLVSFPSKLHFYNWQTKGIKPYLGAISSDRTQAFHRLTSIAVSEKMDCIFCISLFPEDRSFYKIISYQDKQSGEWKFVDDSFKVFDSLSSLIDFYCGSPANYIEIYKQRMRHYQKNAGNRIFISHEQKLIN